MTKEVVATLAAECPEAGEIVPPRITEPTDLDILVQRINDRAQMLGEGETPPRIGSRNQSDNWLKLSYVRKVSPSGYPLPNSNRWVANVPNSFGTPPVDGCPGATETCKSFCYAIKSANASGVEKNLIDNFNMIRFGNISGEGQTEIGIDEKELLITEGLLRYVDFADRTGLPAKDRYFKPDWAGDFDSVETAIAWARAIRNFPDISFWVYTRSYVEPVDVLPYLVGIPNLDLFISVDVNNVDAAIQAKEQYGKYIRFAPTGKTLDDALELLPEEDRYFDDDRKRFLPCPENTGKYALMDERGGACHRCRACFQNKTRSDQGRDRDDRPILFFDKEGDGQISLPLVTVDSVKIRPKRTEIIEVSR